MARILILEDEERIASFVAKGLRAEGHQPTVVADGRLGLDAAVKRLPVASLLFPVPLLKPVLPPVLVSSLVSSSRSSTRTRSTRSSSRLTRSLSAAEAVDVESSPAARSVAVPKAAVAASVLASLRFMVRFLSRGPGFGGTLRRSDASHGGGRG
jgi:hypothetical protein